MKPSLNPYKFIVFALLLMLAGCAAAPVQEMSDARQAVEAALQVGAATRAPEEMQAAQALLERAEQSLAEGRFRDARQQANAARDQALIAQKKALSR